MLEIEKTLVLSTAHISEDTAILLDKYCLHLDIIIDKYEYGWYVYTSYDSLNKIPPDISSSLAYCIKLASANGCKCIKLDQDGPKAPSLPIYDW